MSTKRILIATFAPLTAEAGAGQMALNLAHALREVGHHVDLWTSHPLPEGHSWLWNLRYMRRGLAATAMARSYDLIDAPAPLLSGRITRAARCVARSVQPDLRYLYSGFVEHPSPSQLAYAAYFTRLAAEGWSRASRIACLGTLELEWMRRRFPWWRRKSFAYLNALSCEDSHAVRQARTRRSIRPSHRFLWMGRWVAHKGTRRLRDFLAARLQQHPQERATIAGCGEAAVAELPTGLVQDGQLTVLPRFQRSELSGLLEAHDVGLFTSPVEGWGLVLNEMLESGLTVFATEAGGVPDLRSYFPNQLRPFPPGTSLEVSRALDDLSGYDSVFNWRAIAENYLRQVFD